MNRKGQLTEEKEKRKNKRQRNYKRATLIDQVINNQKVWRNKRNWLSKEWWTKQRRTKKELIDMGPKIHFTDWLKDGKNKRRTEEVKEIDRK